MQAHVRERFPVEIVSPSQEQARECGRVLLLFQAAVAAGLFHRLRERRESPARTRGRAAGMTCRFAWRSARAGADRALRRRGSRADWCRWRRPRSAVLTYLSSASYGCCRRTMLPRLAEIRVDRLTFGLCRSPWRFRWEPDCSLGLVTAVRVLRSVPWTRLAVLCGNRPAGQRSPDTRVLIVAETAAGTHRPDRPRACC